MIQYCKCGKEKRRNKNGKYMGWCGDTICSPNYGIKRPNHSVHMKELARSGTNPKYLATLMKSGELFNKDVNTIKFKETVLINKGIDTSNIEEAHSAFLSGNALSRSIRSKQIITKYNSWGKEFRDLARLCCNIEDVSLSWLNSLSEDVFLNVFKSLHGIQSAVNMRYHQDCGRNKQYIRVRMDNLKYNVRGITSVLTRSKLESKYIELFEEVGAKWDYEWIRVPKRTVGTYSPDFYLEYGDKKYMIEVKGDWYHNDKDEYYKNCIGPAIEYATPLGILVGVTHITPKSMDFLQKITWLNKLT